MCRNQPAEKPVAPSQSPAAPPKNDPGVSGTLDTLLLIGFLSICTFVAKSAPACSMPQLALPGHNDVI
jgi:hypothetical protein